MTVSLIIMVALAALASLLGLPLLLDPAAVRYHLSLRNTPQMVYVLRIVGAMLGSLGLILFVFAATWWRTV